MQTTKYPEDITLFLDGCRGTYIPKNFSESIKREFIINREKWDHELDFLIKYDTNKDFYWETWESVLDNLKVKIGKRIYFFYQSDDLWMIRDNEKTRKEFFKNVD